MGKQKNQYCHVIIELTTRTVAEWSVEADVSQHSAAHVLLFRRHRTEYNARRSVLQPELLRVRDYVCLADRWETEKPENTVGHLHDAKYIDIRINCYRILYALYVNQVLVYLLEDRNPHLECGRVDFVELIKIAIDDSVFG